MAAKVPRTFNDLELSLTSKRAISALGFDAMTPVQAACIPLLLNHRDVVAEACTGSGKTLAFVVPMVEMILRREKSLKPSSVGTLVISPTRELARQTFSVCSHFAACSEDLLGPPLLITGGDAIADNLKKVADAKNKKGGKSGLSMVICTPGRLDDLLNNYELFDLKDLELLILDEADTLLNLGFRPQLTSILSRLPKQRRTGLFSATQTREVKELARAGLRNPASVSVAVRAQTQFKLPVASDENDAGHSTVDMVLETYGVQATPASLTNYYVICEASQKLLVLLRFLHEHRHEKVMVFFLTCAAVEFWERALQSITQDFFENLEVFLDGNSSQSNSLPTKENSGETNGTNDVASQPKKPMREVSVKPDWSHLNAKQRKKQKEKLRSRQKKLEASKSAQAELERSNNSPLNIMGLHGKMDHKKRCGVFAKFKTARSCNTSDQNEEGGGAVLLCTDVAARGLDVQDVDWIVQMDAPQDPAAFVHRVGRAGRAGRKGASLLLLSPSEDAYVEFLALRKVALSPYRCWNDLNAWWLALDEASSREETGRDAVAIDREEPQAKKAKKDQAMPEGSLEMAKAFENKSKELLKYLKAATCKDRDILEHGSKAFMAHLRAYKDHKCEFIFRWSGLDVASIANSMGLIRMPKIPELKGKRIHGFTPDFTVKTEDIPYLNKIKEKARQKRLVVMKEASEAAKKLEEAQKLKAEEQAPKQLSGAAKKQAKKMEEKLKSNPKWSEDGPRKRKGKHELIVEEWDELAKEERLYKKLKKGKISQKEYEKSLKNFEDSDGNQSGGESSGEESGEES